MWFRKVLAYVAIFGILLSGCGSSNSKESGSTSKENQKTAVLKAYNGEYKNVNTVVESAQMDSLFEDVAKEKKSYSKEGARFVFGLALGAYFDSLKIDGSSIEFVKGDKKEIFTYEKTEAASINKDAQGSELLYLKSKEVPKIFKNAQFLVLSQFEKKEQEGFSHFHMRHSSQALGEKAFAHSKPIFATKDTSDEAIGAHFLSHKEKIITKFFSKTSLSDWNGKWKSLGSFIDSDAKPIEEAYAKLTKKYDEYTKDEIKEALRKVLLENVDFKSCNIVAEENKIIFTLKDGSTKEFTYILSGKVPNKHGYWWNFTATDSAGKFQNLLFSVVHGKDEHFHGKQSDKSHEMLAKEPSVPTFMRAEFADEIFAEDLAEFGSYAISQMESKK